MTQEQTPKRIDDLEIQATFQEQLIADLNDELAAQNQRITQLEKQLARLIEHVKDLPEKADTSARDDVPPHY